MTFVIQKVDLDTALTCLLLGYSEGDEIVVRSHGARPEELTDPEVLCVESGGSGDTSRGNFDHHDPMQDLPPACEQAWKIVIRRGMPRDLSMDRLVEYVAALDTGRLPRRQNQEGQRLSTAGLTLSGVFSGMLATVESPQEQLRAGINILRILLEHDLDPFSHMPVLPLWKDYVEKKATMIAALEDAMSAAEYFWTDGRRLAGFISTDVWGALGALYDRGCDVAIAEAPGPTEETSKYTIGGNRGIQVAVLLERLSLMEAGWGGPSHGTVVGSPRGGSTLAPESLCQIVKEVL